jgi:hypothetical protein
MIRRLVMAVMLLGLCLMAAPLPASAFDTTGGVDCSGGTSSSAVCTDNTSTDPISGSDGLLLKITKIVAYIGGAAAIILIIVGALRYITANGDSNALSGARSTIINALIGLIVIVLGASLITFVVGRL